MNDEPLLARARLVAAALVAGPVLTAAVGSFATLQPLSGIRLVTALVAAAGPLSLLAGFHLHRVLAERSAAAAPAGAAGDAFLRATVLSLAPSEAAALLGAVAFLLTREPFTLLPLATHVILGGLLWPSEERLDRFHGR